MLVLGLRLLGDERAAERASFCSAVEQKMFSELYVQNCYFLEKKQIYIWKGNQECLYL